MTNIEKIKLGEILIESGMLSRKQLEHALRLQKRKNTKIGKILVELGHVDENQLADTLAHQLSLPLIDCSAYHPSKEILSLVSKETAEQKHVLPVEKNAYGIVMAMADPLDWRTINDVIFQTGVKVNVAVASESNIISSIEQLYGSSELIRDILDEVPAHDGAEFLKEEPCGDDKGNTGLHIRDEESEAPPVVRLLAHIITDAVNAGASDIHIEPTEQHVQVYYRIDGNLKNMYNFSKRIRDPVISRIKIISNLDITNRRLPQKGRSALRLKDHTIDLRISTSPSIHGEKIVIKLLDSTTGLIPLGQLGISDNIIKSLTEIINKPQGMLLVTGPASSGKTTTLYSILLQLSSVKKSIITLEETVEYKLKNITQVELNEDNGFSFVNALRSILGEDPDIIMASEIRDLDTAETASRSALTGHLVLSTLSASDSVSSITHLINIGLAPFLFTAAVSGVLAQRLIRKICPDCMIEIAPPDNLSNFNLPPLKKSFQGTGCSKCSHTGYKGRTGVYELLVMDANLRRVIAGYFNEDSLWACARASRTKTMFEDAWEKIEEGVTTFNEVISCVPFNKTVYEETVKRSERQNHNISTGN